jgi:dTDP-4-amino-4,6-dideoxygalactose transaminase
MDQKTQTSNSHPFDVRFLDLRVLDEEMKQELLSAVDTVLSHGQLILGPEVQALEDEISKIVSMPYAVGVNSGTDALYLALRSLGIGQGDEVITTSMSWIASANAITLTGAEPRFVDIGDDLNLDPDLIEEAISPKTKAILPVHYTGRVCNMDQIMGVAAKHGMDVIEDSAQAFGAKWKGGVAGSFGRVNCFSMNSMKIFSSYGEAGAVVTSDAQLHEKLVSLRYAGTVNREDCHDPSINGRLHTLQAAMLLVNLKYLGNKMSRRREIAHRYNQEFDGLFQCPVEDEGGHHVYYTYTILAEERDKLHAHLAKDGIETKVYHPILMPCHRAYQHLPRPNIPNAEKLVERILCLPVHEKLTDEHVGKVIRSVKQFFAAA